jgi:hypothetical protein
MSDQRPLIWKTLDSAERSIAPYVELAARTDTFLGALGLMVHVTARVRRAVDGPSMRLWHFANLPTRGDVARLHAHVAAMDRELRRMGTQLERALEGSERWEGSGIEDNGTHREQRATST